MLDAWVGECSRLALNLWLGFLAQYFASAKNALAIKSWPLQAGLGVFGQGKLSSIAVRLLHGCFCPWVDAVIVALVGRLGSLSGVLAEPLVHCWCGMASCHVYGRPTFGLQVRGLSLSCALLEVFNGSIPLKQNLWLKAMLQTCCVMQVYCMILLLW